MSIRSCFPLAVLLLITEYLFYLNGKTSAAITIGIVTNPKAVIEMYVIMNRTNAKYP